MPLHDAIAELRTERPSDDIGANQSIILPLDLVLLPSKRCTVRRQENQYLIYNQKTDELHLLPDDAYRVFALCDGHRPLSSILSAVSAASGESLDSVRAPLERFLHDLIKRDLLKTGPSDDA